MVELLEKKKVQRGLYDDQIIALLAEYKKNGKPIEVSFRQIVQELNNSDRASHLIHTYPAKLLMHIPYFFINNNIFSKRGDSILDPFCGSGTVLLESIIAGRKAIGADANPLARLISEVKTTYYDPKLLRSYLNEIKNEGKTRTKNIPPNVVNIDYWFLPHIKTQLSNLLPTIKKIEDEKYRKFFLVCFSNCIKKVSLADPRVNVPVKLRAKQYHKKHPLRKETENKLDNLNSIDVKSKFSEIVEANIIKIEKYNELLKSSKINRIICNDARDLSSIDNNGNSKKIRKNSVNLIISSPPYAGAQKYIRSSSLNLGWLELSSEIGLKELDNLNIGRENYTKAEYHKLSITNIKEADQLLKRIYDLNPQRAFIAANYLNEMREAINEAVRVLKPNGYFILVAANNQVCGKEFKTQQYLQKIAEDAGLETKLRLIDDIKSYGLMTKRNKTANIITREWILVFKK